MTKIAISSDNHIDVNRLDLDEVLARQAEYLNEQHVDVYLIAGDMFNSFAKTLNYAERLQTALGSETTVRFIAGNHDMGRDVTFDELESNLSPLYLHNQVLDVDDLRIIGNNGWYDYSFASGPEKDGVAQFKRGLYFDRVIEQPMTDPERADLSLQQLQAQLDQAVEEGKRALVIQHFAPHGLDLRYPDFDDRWLMVNGVMGSKRYAELYSQYSNLENVYYGHVHMTLPTREINGVKYDNVSVGYQRARIKEWTGETFIESWINKLHYKVLTND
ncbi:MAG: metallophosphoesterase [Lactobacillaceae bacterium]|jgi:putative phosphoesterase|nr:metallophosphoesterase [Lactobacillaceae bacterium]